jgi:hypothetical protein
MVRQLGREDMSALKSVWSVIWARRKYWRGPIIVMLAAFVLLFTIAMGARILPSLVAAFQDS